MRIFKAVNMNWNCHCVGDWHETVYEIQSNGQYTKIIKMSENQNIDYPDEIIKGQFETKVFEELLRLLSGIREVEAHCAGCDGEGWELTLYGSHGKILYKTTGYVYGISLLENIITLMP